MNLAERLLWPPSVDVQGPLYCDGNETLTRAQFIEATTAVAAGLRRLGVDADDRVVLMMYDTAALPITFLAAIAIGAIPVAVNPTLGSAAFTHILTDSRATVLVVEPDQLGRILTELRGGSFPSQVAVVVQDLHPARAGAERSSLPGVRDWVEAGSSEFEGFYDTSPESIGFWQYTSGTTGNPKAVRHTQMSMIANTELFAKAVLNIGPGDRIYSVPKMFFGYGQGNSLFFPLLTGATACLDSRWPTAERVRDNLRRFRPTVLFAVPTIYHQLLRGSDRVEAADLTSVRMAFSAGAPLKAEIFERWRGMFGLEILDGIGATEVGHVFLSNHPGQARPGVTGMPVAGYDVRLIDSSGLAVEPGQQGVALVSGPSVSPGYWERPEETAMKFTDHWYRTGDLFRQDEEGFYQYLGRQDDLFKVHGRWVIPLEIETMVLSRHEDVTEATVVCVETEAELNLPVLFVVAKLSDDVQKEALAARVLASLAGRLEQHKLPRHCWVVTDLPRNDNGKVVRPLLVQEAHTLVRQRTAEAR